MQTYTFHCIIPIHLPPQNSTSQHTTIRAGFSMHVANLCSLSHFPPSVARRDSTNVTDGQTDVALVAKAIKKTAWGCRTLRSLSLGSVADRSEPYQAGGSSTCLMVDGGGGGWGYWR